jgi:hypothetical protein
MYNIDLYTYWKKPFSLGKNFSIRPLDDEGKETYYSDQSHCKHYLKRTDPFVFKSIVGVDYNTLVRQQKEDIEMLNKLKEKGFNTKGATSTKVEQNENNVERSMHKTNYAPNEEINTINNPNINNEQVNNQDVHHEEINNYNSFNGNRSFRPYNTQNGFRPYNKKRDFKATYGYENKTRFKSNGEKYLYSINSMKKNNFNGDDEVRPKRRYDGFTVTEAPVIERSRPNTASFDYFNNKISQTLNCLNKRDGERKAMNEEEMKTNLFNQTSAAFLKRHHLPDVVKIANSRQVIRRQKIGLSKEMGEKYNPYALIPPSKNRTGRNYVGDLFKH